MQRRSRRKLPLTRSEMMARIRSADTAPEMAVRRTLWHAGLRYRLHDRRLPGRPDIVFRSRKVAIFVHGCFWHRHPGCRHATMPKTRPDFWQTKFQDNIARDAKAVAALEAAGWRTVTVWECEATRPELLAALVDLIRSTEPQSR